jgi:hypothetical protein
MAGSRAMRQLLVDPNATFESLEDSFSAMQVGIVSFSKQERQNVVHLTLKEVWRIQQSRMEDCSF